MKYDTEIEEGEVWICGDCGNANHIYLNNCQKCGKTLNLGNDSNTQEDDDSLDEEADGLTTEDCHHDGKEDESDNTVSRPVKRFVDAYNDGPSLGVKIYDYVLAGISGLEFALQLFKKLSGNSTREWIWVIIPLLLVFGLLQHKKSYRIICSILLFGSILLPFILSGMVAGY